MLLWDKYCELSPQIIDLEASLSEEWLSTELMSALRSENLRSNLTKKWKVVVRHTQAQITSYLVGQLKGVGYLRGGLFNSRRLANIVNYIRQNAESFSEWHQSETAKLFAPPVFRNDRKAAGYWF